MKKRILSLIMAMVTAISLSAPCFTVTAGAEVSGDWEYYIKEDDTVFISNYTGTAAEVTIPSELDGKTVTSISFYAFSGCTKLTAINVDKDNKNYSSKDGGVFNKQQTTLLICPPGKSGSYTVPDGVTSIGDGERQGMTFAGYGAFYGCTRLKSVKIPNSIKA